MAERLDWVLNFDFSGSGTKTAASELKNVQNEVARTNQSLGTLSSQGSGHMGNFAAQAQRGGAAVDSAMGALKTAAMAAAAAVVAAVGAAALALDRFGDRAITAFGQRAGTLRAYTALLGSASAAEAEFGKAQRLAMLTDLTSAQTEAAQKSLMVAGFRGEGLNAALKATLDVASMAAPEERTLASERTARAFAQIFAKGKLQGEELRQITEAGLSRKLILEELGIGSAGDAEKAISAGSVTSDQGIAAIERAILRQFGTSKLGEYATGASGSLTGLLSNRDEAFDNLLKSFDSDQLPAVGRYKTALTELNAAMSLETETGQELSLGLQHMADTSISLKTILTEFSTGFLDTFASSYTQALRDLGYDTTESGERFKEAGTAAHGLGETIGQVGTAAAYLTTALEKMAPLFDFMATAAESMGKTWSLLLQGKPLQALAESEAGLEKLIKFTPHDYASDRSTLQDDAAALQAQMDAYLKGDTAAAQKAAQGPAQARRGASGGGGAGRGHGRGGIDLGGGLLLESGFDSGPGGGLPSAADIRAGVESGMAARTAAAVERGDMRVQIDAINLNVYAAPGSSARDIAEEAELMLWRRIGRISRNPGPAT